MRSNTVKTLRDSLNAILTLDPKATFQFEDVGSGTTCLNIFFSHKAIQKITLQDLDRLEALDVSGNDEGETPEERFMGDEKNMLFICLS